MLQVRQAYHSREVLYIQTETATSNAVIQIIMIYCIHLQMVNTCFCRSKIYKGYGGFKKHCFDFITVLVFVKSECSLSGLLELCRSSHYAGQL